MKYETFVNTLIREGTIERTRINRFRILLSERTRALGIIPTDEATADDIRRWFGRIAGGQLVFRDYQTGARVLFAYSSGITSERRCQIGSEIQLPNLPEGHLWARPIGTYRGGEFVTILGPVTFSETVQRRRLQRDGYHSHGYGTGRDGVDSALRAIVNDADGVRRSYGLEWEIYSLTEQQESALCALLDTLPDHFTERDGSLTSTGVEIVFLPLGEEKFKETWNKLQEFCIQNHVGMDGAGAHVTYGVSNAHVSLEDLQVRLNRAALAVKSASTQGAIKRVFGRDFTGYAHLPSSTTEREHSNAFSASRGNSAWECRLCAYKGSVDKIVEFLKATEFVFNRPFTAADFMKIFNVMGASADGV